MPTKALSNPRHNAFYLFLKEKFHQQRRADPIQIELKTSADNVPYAFIPFPVTHAQLFINEKKFRVIENHISIFSGYLSENNEDEDEYHYTATLQDSDGTEYKLRCYFNSKNEAASSLVLKQMANQRGETEHYLTIPTQVHYVLNMWINAETDKVIQPLSNEQSLMLSERINGLEQKVQTLLYAYDGLVMDLAYIENLQKEAKKFASEEKKITSFQPHYQSISLNILRETLDWRKAEIITHQLSEREKAQAINLATAQTSKMIKPTETVKKKSAKKQKKKPTSGAAKDVHQDLMLMDPAIFQADLDVLKNKIDTLNSEQTPTQQAHQLRQYYSDIHLFSLQVEGIKQYQLPIKELKNTLLSKITTLIHQAIEQESQETIQLLLNHIDLAPIHILRFAIDTNHGAFVESILNAYSYAINRIQLKFADADDEYMSPLTYAYENRSEQAFAILLKHDANPFVLWRQDLPLIHHILTNVGDKDFYPVMLEKIYQRGHKAIFSHLIQILENTIHSNSKLTSQEIEILHNKIADYHTSISLTFNASHTTQARIAHSDGAFISEFEAVIPKELRAALDRDPEFRFIKSCYASARNEFCNKLSLTQLNKFNLAGKEIMDNTLKNFELIKNSLTVDALKENLRCQTELLPKVSRLLEIQKVAHNQRSVGAAKELNKEYTKLEREIQILQNKLNSTTQEDAISLLVEKFESTLRDLRTRLKTCTTALESINANDENNTKPASPDSSSVAKLLGNSVSNILSESTKSNATSDCSQDEDDEAEPTLHVKGSVTK